MQIHSEGQGGPSAECPSFQVRLLTAGHTMQYKVTGLSQIATLPVVENVQPDEPGLHQQFLAGTRSVNITHNSDIRISFLGLIPS